MLGNLSVTFGNVWWLIAIPLAVLTVALGIFPQSMLLSWMGPSVDRMVRSVAVAVARPVEDEKVKQAKILFEIAEPLAQMR